MLHIRGYPATDLQGDDTTSRQGQTRTLKGRERADCWRAERSGPHKASEGPGA